MEELGTWGEGGCLYVMWSIRQYHCSVTGFRCSMKTHQLCGHRPCLGSLFPCLKIKGSVIGFSEKEEWSYPQNKEITGENYSPR